MGPPFTHISGRRGLKPNFQHLLGLDAEDIFVGLGFVRSICGITGNGSSCLD